MIVLDASGSMAADDAPGVRMEAAKSAVRSLVAGLPEGSPLGLLVYGTGTDSSDAAKATGCKDIKTVVQLGPLNRSVFDHAVSEVKASGYTPIGAALKAAVAALPSSGPRSVVLVSDGDDTCAPLSPDPCEVAKEIHDQGADLTVHTVGFKVSGTARDQLDCIAKATGGTSVTASNAVALAARLKVAADPAASRGKLTADGYAGMKIGMTTDQARALDPSVTAASTGRVVVVWKDCDVTFQDGVLVSIAPHTPVPTAEGLAVGDDVADAVQLYGDAAPSTDDHVTHAVFASRDGSQVGYDVTFEPSRAPTELTGTIITIVVCLCRPRTPPATSGPAVPTDKVTTGDLSEFAGEYSNDYLEKAIADSGFNRYGYTPQDYYQNNTTVFTTISRAGNDWYYWYGTMRAEYKLDTTKLPTNTNGYYRVYFVGVNGVAIPGQELVLTLVPPGIAGPDGSVSDERRILSGVDNRVVYREYHDGWWKKYQ